MLIFLSMLLMFFWFSLFSCWFLGFIRLIFHCVDYYRFFSSRFWMTAKISLRKVHGLRFLWKIHFQQPSIDEDRRMGSTTLVIRKNCTATPNWFSPHRTQTRLITKRGPLRAGSPRAEKKTSHSFFQWPPKRITENSGHGSPTETASKKHTDFSANKTPPCFSFTFSA